jgi:general nucleoside transport system ATP-binding protein
LTQLEALGISKTYGPVRALTDAAISLAAGQIHAIVGENGAGKSTLAKILAGAIVADGGTIILDRKSVSFRRRQDAIAHGIGFVPQTLSLVGALTLIENHALNQHREFVNTRAIRDELDAVTAQAGLSVAFDVPVGRLSVAERQLGELLIALAQGARILLLDEPTSLLGPHEVDRLIRCLKDLARTGVALGLVTHRIAEVLECSDAVTVLRGGRLAHQGPTAGLTADELARLMVGERGRTVASRERPRDNEPRLEASHLTVVVNGVTLLDDVELTVRRGEIVGVAGVADTSQVILAELLAGLRRPDRGSVRLDGVEITARPTLACRLGVAHVADDRALGLAADRTVGVNASLLQLQEPRFRRFGLRNPAAERRYGQAICEDFNVEPPQADLPAGGLSGGNQQKLILGRELARAPKAIVVHSPTQGLDLKATAAIHNRLLDIAGRGAAVVVISADLDEVISLSDRLVVLSAGRFVDAIDLAAGPPDAARLGAAMARGRVPQPIDRDSQ